MTRRRIRYTDKDNSGIILRIVCAIVFCLLSFTYLFVYQQDVIAFRFFSLFGGTGNYNPVVFSVLAVMAGYAMHAVSRFFLKHYKPFYAVTYIPSLALLWCLAELDVSRVAGWVVLAILVFVLLLFMLLFARHDFFLWHMRNVRTLSRKLWLNVMAMSLGFMFISMGSGYDDVMRFRLKMERMIASGDYVEASEVGKTSSDTDVSLTMLRIYALSKSGKLGDTLFRYPVTGGSRALLPDGKNVDCLMLDACDIYKYVGLDMHGKADEPALMHHLYEESGCEIPARDYILCGHLLDKDIDGFVKSLIKCGVKDLSSLPRHYREALILYCHTRSGHILTYKNAAMDADYDDMQALEKKHTLSPDECRSFVKDAYGNTYWYYYYYMN